MRSAIFDLARASHSPTDTIIGGLPSSQNEAHNDSASPGNAARPSFSFACKITTLKRQAAETNVTSDKFQAARTDESSEHNTSTRISAATRHPKHQDLSSFFDLNDPRVLYVDSRPVALRTPNRSRGLSAALSAAISFLLLAPRGFQLENKREVKRNLDLRRRADTLFRRERRQKDYNRVERLRGIALGHKT